MAFIHIIIESLKKKVEYPTSIKEEEETDNDNDKDKLYSLFDFNSNSKLLLKDIIFKVRENNIYFTQKKVKRLIMNKGITFKKTSQGQTAFNISFVNDDIFE